MSRTSNLSISTPDYPSNGLVVPGKFVTVRQLALICGFDEIFPVWTSALDAPLVMSPPASRDDFRLARPTKALDFAEAGLALYRANLRAASLAEQLVWYANHPKGRHLMPLLAPALWVQDGEDILYPCISRGQEDEEEIITLGARLLRDGLTQHDWILTVPLSPRL